MANALDAILAQMGAVPQGATPKNIDLSAGQTEPSWQDTSAIGSYLRQMQAEEKKRQDKAKQQADAYKTLRDAGYSPKDAGEVALSGKFRVPTENYEDLDETKKKLENEKLRKELNPPEGTYGVETLKNATQLRGEFEKSKSYKDYQEVERAQKGIAQAYKMATSGDTESRIASDQALGVLFQKMLDPESVVRESEYARTPEGVSVLNKLKSVLPKLQRGGLGITNEDRLALYEMAKKLLDVSQERVNSEINRYSELGSKYGVPSELILGNIKTKKVYAREGIDQTTGKRVGQLSDGTIEYIE